MGVVTLAVPIVIGTAVADSVFCGFDCYAEQYWVDVLASAFTGLVLLPFVFLLTWGFHRLDLDRWLVLTSSLVIALSVIFTSVIDMFIAPIFLLISQVLEMIGVNRFMYFLMPNLLVWFGGAISFGWWLRRHAWSQDIESLE